MRRYSLLFLAAAAAAQEQSAGPVFMRPDPADKAAPAAYVRITDAAELARYQQWTQIPSARMALDLYADARSIAQSRGLSPDQPAAYHISIEAGGNYPAQGFRLKTAEGVRAYPDAVYIKLDPSEDFFRSTLFHETGHIAVAMLDGGKKPRARQMAALSHSNAALTDRVTAFDEGFGIHLETTAAHLVDEPAMRNRYRHEQMLFGLAPGRRAEYSRQAADLLSFAQSVGRYYDVRENAFAFESSSREPDYIRAQYEKSRDFATLRDANQLLQSEGFYASFFFSLVARGDARPSPETARERRARILETLADLFANRPVDADSPFLLYFVEQYGRRYPSEKEEAIDVLLDLSHGVFVDPDAARIWREYYLAALHLDLEKVRSGAIEAARKRWREAVLKDPAVLYSRLGPQIRCAVPEVKVGLVAFGQPRNLAFDVNTAQEAVLRLIPGISPAEVGHWIAERARKPFASPDDLRARAALPEPVLARLSCGDPGPTFR